MILNDDEGYQELNHILFGKNSYWRLRELQRILTTHSWIIYT